MSISLFKKFSPALEIIDGLIPDDNVTDILFADREGVVTAHIGVKTLEDIEAIIGDSLPEEIRSIDAKRYGVDLDTIGTSSLRLYVDNREPADIALYGYYLDEDLNVLQTKVYKKADEKTTLYVDRYDAEGNLLQEDDPEVETDEIDWTGSTEIAEIAKENGMPIVYLRKLNRNQVYLRIENSIGVL